MVIGGGPGGLSAAWIAAQRGHEVHLFERKGVIGGKLIAGSVSGFKKEVSNLIKFLAKQTAVSGVEWHLNCEVTAAVIRASNPDVVILATGAMPVLPPVEGIDSKIVVTVDDVLNGRPPDRVKTVVAGGGASGCEAALYLSELGCRVTLVEMLPRIAFNHETITRKVILEKLEENRVQSLTDSKVIRIYNHGVQISAKDGGETFIGAGRIVMATGYQPDNRVYRQMAALTGYEIHQIGDCIEPRSIKEAIYEGTVVGGTV